MQRFSAVNKLTAYIAVSMVCLYIGEPAFSQTDDVDTFIEEQIKMQRIPGLSLAVVKEGRIVKVKGYGFANLELRAPAKASTLYALGSISKQFTATSIMLLVELGQIDLDIKTAFGPLKFEPGDKFAYSNVGYRLLGVIIEKVSGLSYWEFLDEHIFKPLGMNATRNSDPKTIFQTEQRDTAGRATRM